MADILRQQLDNLPADQLAYVHERSKTLTAKDAYEAAGISRSKFYDWDADARDRLDELANELRANRVVMAEPKLNDAIEKALDVVIELMNTADSDTVRFRAAQEILNRTLGKPTDKVEHTGADGGAIRIQTVTDLSDDDLARIASGGG